MKYIILVICLFISGCAVVPEKIRVYDKDCDISYKQYSLKIEEHNYIIDSCDSNEKCIVEILFIPVTSFVISGSVVIVGNVVNWLEKEGACLLKN